MPLCLFESEVRSSGRGGVSELRTKDTRHDGDKGIAFNNARVAGSEQITSSVAQVSALIGSRNFGANHWLALSGISKPGRADGELLSGSRDGSCRGRSLVSERGRNVADADDADQAVIVDDRQMADVVLVHQMTNVFQRIG